MPTSKTWNNTSYSIPNAGELNWSALTSFLTALADNAQTVNFQKFAVRVATTSPVTVSAANDCIVVTNLAVAGAVAVNLPAGSTKQLFFIVDGKGDAATNNVTITPAAGNINGAATYVINVNNGGVALVYNGTEWTVFGEYANATSGSGNIPRSKIAAGTASHVVINDGSGFLSSEAQLAGTRGGTGVSNAGQLSFGANNITLTTAGVTALTLPLTGTVATLLGSEAFQSKTIDGSLNTITNVSLTTGVTGVLPTANGGTNQNSTATFPASGTVAVVPASGVVKSNGTVLSSSNVSLTTEVTGVLPTANGGTGQNSTATFPTSGTVLTDSNTPVTVTGKDIDGGTASNTLRLTIPKNTKANLDLLTRKEATLVFATDTQSAYLDYNSTLNPLGGAGVTLTVTQAAHGFVAANVGAPLYLNLGVYTLAKADAANTAEVVGVIDAIIDTNTFNLKEAGSVTVNTAVSGGGALVAGTVYFLSAATAGQITATEPTTVGYVSKPLGVANSTTTMILTQSRGVVVGGANARTTISLANNATTTVQNVSAYAAGELSGWITIAATTPLQFYVQAQFAKNGAASDYNIAYQTTGDTPPVGFSLTVTSGGLVQAVLPSITGYTSASINYALNAPAVGTSFPLSVQASSVLGQTTGTAPAAGYIGEVLSQTRLRSAGTALTTATEKDVTATALTLTPGVWRIWGSFGLDTGFTTTYTQVECAISKTPTTIPSLDTRAVPTSGEAVTIWARVIGEQFGNDRTFEVSVPAYSISASTPFYLVAKVAFATAGSNVYGSIFATRIA